MDPTDTVNNLLRNHRGPTRLVSLGWMLMNSIAICLVSQPSNLASIHTDARNQRVRRGQRDRFSNLSINRNRNPSIRIGMINRTMTIMSTMIMSLFNPHR